jgi:hypothetical protein
VCRPNTTLTGPDGTLHRAGDELEVADDDTAAWWLGAGVVAKVTPPEKR